MRAADISRRARVNRHKLNQHYQRVAIAVSSLLSFAAPSHAEFLMAWGDNTFNQLGSGMAAVEPYARLVSPVYGNAAFFGAGVRHSTYTDPDCCPRAVDSRDWFLFGMMRRC